LLLYGLEHRPRDDQFGASPAIPDDRREVRMQPHRDLFLSPDHAVFANGVLIPVKYLINGASIAQMRVDAVTYFHVELPRHEALLAEGLAAESYLDTGNRGDFVNQGESMRLHPDFASVIRDGRRCAELVITGPVFEAVQQQVDARAHSLALAA
jgi:collagen type I/II/III/V/XI/XXIV/XXVII alpha